MKSKRTTTRPIVRTLLVRDLEESNQDRNDLTESKDVAILSLDTKSTSEQNIRAVIKKLKSFKKGTTVNIALLFHGLGGSMKVGPETMHPSVIVKLITEDPEIKKKKLKLQFNLFGCEIGTNFEAAETEYEDLTEDLAVILHSSERIMMNSTVYKLFKDLSSPQNPKDLLERVASSIKFSQPLKFIIKKNGRIIKFETQEPAQIESLEEYKEHIKGEIKRFLTFCTQNNLYQDTEKQEILQNQTNLLTDDFTKRSLYLYLLDQAFRSGDDDAVFNLITKVKAILGIEKFDPQQSSGLLHAACASGNYLSVASLIAEIDPNFNTQLQDSELPLIIVCKNNGNLEIAKLLLNDEFIDRVDIKRGFPLSIACEHDNLDIVKLLLETSFNSTSVRLLAEADLRKLPQHPDILMRLAKDNALYNQLTSNPSLPDDLRQALQSCKQTSQETIILSDCQNMMTFLNNFLRHISPNSQSEDPLPGFLKLNREKNIFPQLRDSSTIQEIIKEIRKIRSIQGDLSASLLQQTFDVLSGLIEDIEYMMNLNQKRLLKNSGLQLVTDETSDQLLTIGQQFTNSNANSSDIAEKFKQKRNSAIRNHGYLDEKTVHDACQTIFDKTQNAVFIPNLLTQASDGLQDARPKTEQEIAEAIQSAKSHNKEFISTTIFLGPSESNAETFLSVTINLRTAEIFVNNSDPHDSSTYEEKSNSYPTSLGCGLSFFTKNFLKILQQNLGNNTKLTTTLSGANGILAYNVTENSISENNNTLENEKELKHTKPAFSSSCALYTMLERTGNLEQLRSLGLKTKTEDQRNYKTFKEGSDSMLHGLMMAVSAIKQCEKELEKIALHEPDTALMGEESENEIEETPIILQPKNKTGDRAAPSSEDTPKQIPRRSAISRILDIIPNIFTRKPSNTRTKVGQIKDDPIKSPSFGVGGGKTKGIVAEANPKDNRGAAMWAEEVESDSDEVGEKKLDIEAKQPSPIPKPKQSGSRSAVGVDVGSLR